MAPTELRCENRILHGVLEEGFLEVKCRSARCGAQPGVVIIHRFSVATGDLLETKKFRDPQVKKGGQDAAQRNRAAVRSA